MRCRKAALQQLTTSERQGLEVQIRGKNYAKSLENPWEMDETLGNRWKIEWKTRNRWKKMHGHLMEHRWNHSFFKRNIDLKHLLSCLNMGCSTAMVWSWRGRICFCIAQGRSWPMVDAQWTFRMRKLVCIKSSLKPCLIISPRITGFMLDTLYVYIYIYIHIYIYTHTRTIAWVYKLGF